MSERAKNLKTDVSPNVGYSSPLELDIGEELRHIGYRTVLGVGSSSFRKDLSIVDLEELSAR